MITYLKDIDFPETAEYSTDSDRLPLEFFMDSILAAQEAYFKLGYFSSKAIQALAESFALFIYKGGKLMLVTNHLLTEADQRLIGDNKLEEEREKYLESNVLSNVEKLFDTLSNYDQHFFDCLKYLLKNDRLIIQPVMLEGNRMTHYKEGVFYDGNDYISFTGSTNFTYSGLNENAESLQVSRSWLEGSEKSRTHQRLTSIQNILDKRSDQYTYLSKEAIQKLILEKGQDKNPDELLRDSLELQKQSRVEQNPKISRKRSLVKEIMELEMSKPRFPFPQGPRDYQKEAYEKWVENDYKGIFAMATGTGKTITALNCVLEEYKKNNSYHAIILVPSKALLEQWINEVSQFNFSNIIVIGGGHNGMKLMPNFASNFKAGLKKDIIIISTYASFSSDSFLKSFSRIQSDFMLIADEAHNMGANKLKKAMSKLIVPKRIGLSATPKRKYDPEGTDAICDFFSDHPPFCYSFGMRRAMAEGRLTDYYYYPRIVYLDEDEKEEYIEISNALIKFFDFELGKFKDSPVAQSLLLQRKAIIHQARRKIPAYKEILRELNQKGKLKYIFTYVPVGSSKEEQGNSDDIANRFVYQYLSAAQEVKPDLRSSTYTSSSTGDRASKIRGFSEGKVDMLLAMKMLDEGVDIPRAEIGIFASSTGNPREYIQRRGRLLRNHDDKEFAQVYDMIVAPVPSHDNKRLYQIERNMVRNELIRVGYFASLSMNFYDSKGALQDICTRYGLDLDLIINELEND